MTLAQTADFCRRPAIIGVRVSGGSFLMGSNVHYPEEAPARRVSVHGFWIDRYPVTNADFAAFVEDTGYLTLAERAPSPEEFPGIPPELLSPSSVVFAPPADPVDFEMPSNWWKCVPGASWRHPLGPGSDLEGKEKHPVVHVAHEDAEAYARWIGKSLPTEAEWEFAARGGLDGEEFAWGADVMPDGQVMANIWQGEFPWRNLGCAGYRGTSPVGAFPPNGYGLYDMIGNVWEWTSDWYQVRRRSTATFSAATRERSYDPRMPGMRVPRKVIKGGSYLSAANCCRRYRPAARLAQPIDTPTCHIGFRCVVRSLN